MNNNGVSLLELTVVMAVMMLVLGIALFGARAGDRAHQNLNEASRVLQADIRYAQRLAIIEGERIRLIFAERERRYTLVRPSTQEVIRSVDLPQGVSVVGFVNVLEYLPRGTVNVGMTITLRNERFSQSITITPVTGRAHIYDPVPVE